MRKTIREYLIDELGIILVEQVEEILNRKYKMKKVKIVDKFVESKDGFFCPLLTNDNLDYRCWIKCAWFSQDKNYIYCKRDQIGVLDENSNKR